MVVTKRTEIFNNGFRVPPIPKAPRSARGKRKEEDDERDAIELLASLAGKILQDSESSDSSNASLAGDLPSHNGVNTVKSEHLLCSDGNVLTKRGSDNVESDSFLERCSVVTNIGDSDGFKTKNKRLRDDAVYKAYSFSNRRNRKVVYRDDDEKFLKVNRPSFQPKSWRVRRMFPSRYWRLPRLKDYEHSNSDFWESGRRNSCEKRKMCSGRERYYRDAICKRRRFSECNYGLTSDGGFSSESVCNSPENGFKNASAIKLGVNASSSSLSHQNTFLSKGSQVKFSIRSIKIPDLLLEVPETVTVASLKRQVMEAVNSLLRDGLRIGVLLHGKKVREDNRTLLQSGITSKDNLDTLSFTIEPPPPPREPPVPSTFDARYSVAPDVDTGNSDVKTDLPVTILPNQLADKPHEIVADNLNPDSKALVLLPLSNQEPLAVALPVPQKAKRSDHAQRRTRRPFSVAEVEALVKAVEELGTGRWRDVKLRSFESAEHRTYVDLKDKWKTLVHTARISPQQRRGEPVPQELLDRVLAAHAYWAQQQGRCGGKNQAATLRIAEGGAVEGQVGAC